MLITVDEKYENKTKVQLDKISMLLKRDYRLAAQTAAPYCSVAVKQSRTNVQSAKTKAPNAPPFMNLYETIFKYQCARKVYLAHALFII
jgi:hypothetical protein